MIIYPISGKFDVFFIIVISNIIPIVLHCSDASRSASAKRVKNNIPLIRIKVNQPVRQFNWKWSRMANLFALTAGNVHTLCVHLMKSSLVMVSLLICLLSLEYESLENTRMYS